MSTKGEFDDLYITKSLSIYIYLYIHTSHIYLSIVFLNICKHIYFFVIDKSVVQYSRKVNKSMNC